MDFRLLSKDENQECKGSCHIIKDKSRCYGCCQTTIIDRIVISGCFQIMRHYKFLVLKMLQNHDEIRCQRCCQIMRKDQFLAQKVSQQDPVSTMQKTGWTIHSPFLVLFGLKKNFTLVVINRGQATTIFLCIGPFSAWSRTNERTTG